MLHDPSVWQFKLQSRSTTCPAGEATLRADSWKVIQKAVKAGIRKLRAGLKRWHEAQRPENQYTRVALKLVNWLLEEFPSRVNMVCNDAKHRLAVNVWDDELAVSIKMVLGQHNLNTHVKAGPFSKLNQVCLVIADSEDPCSYDLFSIVANICIDIMTIIDTNTNN
jgi:hypothetical protein